MDINFKIEKKEKKIEAHLTSIFLPSDMPSINFIISNR
jgi:hypothetical protein